jgi:hypothetical protein
MSTLPIAAGHGQGLVAFDSATVAPDSLRLYDRARAATWSPKQVISRTTRPRSSDDADLEFRWTLATRHVYVEQTGMSVFGMMIQEAPDAAVRLAMATTISDEAKHAEAFARYAVLVGGSIGEPPESVEDLCTVLRSIPDPFARFVTVTVLEWLALDQLAVLRRLFVGDALYEIYCHVRSDEARHVAMGLEYLHRAVEERSREEIRELCDEALARVPFSKETLSFMDSRLGLADDETHAVLLRRHEQRVRSLVVRGRG